MKKFSKIMAVVLTFCLLGGMLAVFSSASTPFIDPENQLVVPANGSGKDLVSGNFGYSDYESTSGTKNWSHNQQMDSLSYTAANAVRKDPISGNTYYNIRRNLGKNVAENNGNSGYVEWKVSSWNAKDNEFRYNDMVANYDYAVLDLEVGTYDYRVQVGYSVIKYNKSGTITYKIEAEYRTYGTIDEEVISKDIDSVWVKFLSDVEANKASLDDAMVADTTAKKMTVEEAIATKTLAFAEGANFYCGVRTNTSTTNAYGDGKASVFTVYVYTNYVGGKWVLSNSDGSVIYYTFDDTPGDFAHVSFVLYQKGATLYNYLFVEGEYCDVKSAATAVMTPDTVRLQMPAAKKSHDLYSYAFDNLTMNYYERGYDSGSAYGLDDYMPTSEFESKPLYNCEDVVYNKRYIGLNGYMSVDGLAASVSDEVIAEVCATVKNGSKLVTSLDINNFVMPEGVTHFDVEVIDGANFELHSDYSNIYMVENVGGNLYHVRPALEDEKITVKWIYVDENGEQTVVHVERIIGGNKPNENSSALTQAEFLVDELVLRTTSYVGWMFDIDRDSGDVDLFDMEPLRKLSNREVGLILEEFDGVLEIFSTGRNTWDTEKFEFYIGEYTDNGFELHTDSEGGYDKYYNVSNFSSEFEKLDDGETLVLAPGHVLELGSSLTIMVPAGKTVGFDMNGAVLSRSNPASNYPKALFQMKEGSTFNISSSTPGAHFSEACLSSPSSNGVFSTGGLVEVPTAVNGCVINVDGTNINFTSGTTYKFNGGWDTNTGTPNPSDDVKKVLNISGGNYYAPFRSSYAVFCVLAPDVEINIEDAKFYVHDDSYALVHDYGNTGSMTYASQHELYAKNCTFIAENKAKTSYGNIYYRFGANSTAYFEGCTIVGKLTNGTSNFGGNITLGAGNTVSTPSDYLKHSKFHIDEGVNTINVPANTQALEFDVVRSNIGNRLEVVKKDSSGNYYYDESTGVYNVVNGKYVLNIDLLVAENLITERVDGFYTNLLTFNEENVPEGVISIKWYNSDETVLATTYALPGSTVEAYDITKVKSIDTESKWYNVGFSHWENITEGAASVDSLTVVDGVVNEFKPAGRALVADIEAMINMSYWSHFSVNLHVPQETGITFDPSGKNPEAAFYDKTTLLTSNYGTTTVDYNGQKIATYYIMRYPNTDTFDYVNRTVKFIVQQYDVNGNGVIEDDEKNIKLEQTFRLQDLEYSIRVAKTFECGSDETKLIASFVRYKYHSYYEIKSGNLDSAAKAYFDEFNAILASHGENCTCYNDLSKIENDFTDAELAINADSYAPLKEAGVVGVSYALNINKPGISVIVPNDGKTYEIKVTYKDLITGSNVEAKTKATSAVTIDGIVCTRYDYRSILAEQINAIFTISVSVDGGEKIYGQYCLAEYIENNPDYTPAKAFYDYSSECLKRKLKIKETSGAGQYGVTIDYE